MFTLPSNICLFPPPHFKFLEITVVPTVLTSMQTDICKHKAHTDYTSRSCCDPWCLELGYPSIMAAKQIIETQYKGDPNREHH